MAEEEESASSEVADDVTPESEETEPITEETPEPEKLAPSEDTPEPEKAETEGKPGAPKERSERIEESIKKMAIENRQLRREIRALSQQPKREAPKLSDPPMPDIGNFDTIEDFNAAHKDWQTKHDAYIANKTQLESQQRTQTEAVDKQRKTDQETWAKRERETIKRNPEYNLQTAFDDVAPTPLMDGFIMEEEIGPDILWHLAQNPEEAERIREIKSPYRQTEALIALRNTLSNQIKGIKPKSPSTKPPGEVKAGSAAPSKTKYDYDVLYG
jgi:hypothetical protein